MAYSTQKEAAAVGEELCPVGWEFEVWENFGWHVRWKIGPVCVHESSDYTFHAFVSPDPDTCGSGGCWTTPGRSDTILDAADIQIAAFHAYMIKCQQIGQAIAAKLPDRIKPWWNFHSN